MPSCTASSLPSRAVHGCCVSGRQNAARMPAALPLLVRRALAGTAGSTQCPAMVVQGGRAARLVGGGAPPAAPAAPAAVPCHRQNNGPEMCAAPAAGHCARQDNRPEPLPARSAGPALRSRCRRKPVRRGLHLPAPAQRQSSGCLHGQSRTVRRAARQALHRSIAAAGPGTAADRRRDLRFALRAAVRFRTAAGSAADTTHTAAQNCAGPARRKPQLQQHSR